MTEEVCTICLNVMKDNLTITKCNHCFHKHCIDEWIQKSNNCPNCRECFETVLPNKYIRDHYVLYHSGWSSNAITQQIGRIGRVIRLERENIPVVEEDDDILLVMDQTFCTREEAIVALSDNNGDLVCAIMQLTI